MSSSKKIKQQKPQELLLIFTLTNKRNIMSLFLANFKSQLQTSIVKFQYVKKDGTIGEGFGTTNIMVIPQEKRPKGVMSDEALAVKNSQTVSYYDLKKQGWRSFKVENDFIVIATIAI
jgi:hypothetical protein